MEKIVDLSKSNGSWDNVNYRKFNGNLTIHKRKIMEKWNWEFWTNFERIKVKKIQFLIISKLACNIKNII